MVVRRDSKSVDRMVGPTVVMMVAKLVNLKVALSVDL